jgi:hypothetical protein
VTTHQAHVALSAAEPVVFWADNPNAPTRAPQLTGTVEADLTIVGGGFTGLWAAIQALEDDPGMRVVILEAERCGFGATSRNGGFCDSSLTHGLGNGIDIAGFDFAPAKKPLPKG